ncbi:hypothetical protein ADN00_13320 [Ornatilinea apprima]|uniref:Glycosyltransferase subfamily 4-like N-terminal domain-containing protein n=1 Tax=Ornatilinea apprima TaxID=1134406 RepID=A0A0P6X4I9_9CHLR|nr:glycosyltransferase family 4 protein [Ornatilinea apprima]KPL74820.1 hypothetical protein ADN00_13320 [Ornatilinea apprima]
MKIVISVHHFPPDRIGGAELRAFDMAMWLMQMGHEVRVVTVRNLEKDEQSGIRWSDEEYQGIPVRRLTLVLPSNDKLRFVSLYDNPLIEENLRKYLEAFQPDVFHMVSGYLLGAGAVRAAKSLGIPVTITLTDFWFICPRINMLKSDGSISNKDEFNPETCARCLLAEKRRFQLVYSLFSSPGVSELRQWIEHRLVSQKVVDDLAEQVEQRYITLMGVLDSADSLIFPSRYLLSVCKTRGVTPEKMVYIPHGIHTIGEVQRASLTQPPIRVGYLGQVEHHKGVHLLIEAFLKAASAQDMRLSLFGSSSSNQDYQHKIELLARQDDRIELRGGYSISEIPEILSKLDVVVIPSLWNEIGPLVMFEALRSKVPVIASNIPNMSYEIQDGINGLLFEVGNEDALADILSMLAQHPEKLDGMSRNIQPVRTLEQEMEEIQQIYRQKAG